VIENWIDCPVLTKDLYDRWAVAHQSRGLRRGRRCTTSQLGLRRLPPGVFQAVAVNSKLVIDNAG
jgi:hypothetical protein